MMKMMINRGETMNRQNDDNNWEMVKMMIKIRRKRRMEKNEVDDEDDGDSWERRMEKSTSWIMKKKMIYLGK